MQNGAPAYAIAIANLGWYQACLRKRIGLVDKQKK